MSRPGDIVTIRSGSYGKQVIRADPAKKSARRRVVFRPAEGATVEVDHIEVYGQRVSFESLTTNGWYVRPGARDVVFKDVRNTDSFYITSASEVSVIGGSVGPGADYSPQIKSCTGCSAPPRDILISGVRFHDWIRRTPGTHVDCLHVMAVDGLVIRKSRFRNCEHFDILFTKFGSAGTPRNVLIENNFFSCCRSGYYSVYLGGGHGETYGDYMIRNNSANKPMAVCSDCTISGRIAFYSNIAPNIVGCGLPGIRGDYNVLGGGSRCGQHDSFGASGFVDSEAFDFRLRNRAVAIDHGDPENAPAGDIFSHRRPRGSAPDAGAQEAR